MLKKVSQRSAISYFSWLFQGAEVDALDKHCHTPLLLATSRGAWRTASFLIQRGASHVLKDDKNRNLMHLVVLSGGCVNILGVDISAVNKFL